jgi:hypothetical protein
MCSPQNMNITALCYRSNVTAMTLKNTSSMSSKKKAPFG